MEIINEGNNTNSKYLEKTLFTNITITKAFKL